MCDICIGTAAVPAPCDHHCSMASRAGVNGRTVLPIPVLGISTQYNNVAITSVAAPHAHDVGTSGTGTAMVPVLGDTHGMA